MWCVPTLTPEFIERMEDILDLYAKPYDAKEPVICFDEKSKQLLKDTRPIQQTKPGKPRQRDYEYERNGTRNIFMAVEPKGGRRETTVTKRRTKKDFAREIARIITLPRYRAAHHIHVVLDNLNTHFVASFIETFGRQKARRLLRRIRFHYTPKHASWLNMAEIELSIVSRQTLGGRIPDEDALNGRIRLWRNKRNRAGATIKWKFTKDDARKIFKYDQTGN